METDADVDLNLPQSVAFGAAYRLTAKLTVLGQARWTNYPEFEDGDLEFSDVPALDQSFLRFTKARFRFGGALEYAWNETITLRGGFSREEWMIEEEDLTLLLIDNTDVIVNGGLGVDLDPLRLDAIFGFPIYEDRVVSADRNPNFPGRFEQEGMVFGIGMTYRFGD